MNKAARLEGFILSKDKLEKAKKILAKDPA